MSSLFDKLFKTNQHNKQRFGMLYQSFLKSKKRSRFQSEERRIKSKSSLIDKSKFLYDIPDSMIFPNTSETDETEENADVFLKEFGELLDKDYYLPESVLVQLGLSHLIEKNNQQEMRTKPVSEESSSESCKNKTSLVEQTTTLPRSSIHKNNNPASPSNTGKTRNELMNEINLLKRKYNTPGQQESSSPKYKNVSNERNGPSSNDRTTPVAIPSICNNIPKKPNVPSKISHCEKNPLVDNNTSPDGLEIVFCQEKKKLAPLSKKPIKLTGKTKTIQSKLKNGSSVGNKDKVPSTNKRPLTKPSSILKKFSPKKPSLVHSTSTIASSSQPLSSSNGTLTSTSSTIPQGDREDICTEAPSYQSENKVIEQPKKKNKKSRVRKRGQNLLGQKPKEISHDMFHLLTNNMHLFAPYLENNMNTQVRNEIVKQQLFCSNEHGLPPSNNAQEKSNTVIPSEASILNHDANISKYYENVNQSQIEFPRVFSNGKSLRENNLNQSHINKEQQRIIGGEQSDSNTSERDLLQNQSITSLLDDSISTLTGKVQLDKEVKTEVEESNPSQDENQLRPSIDENARRPLIFLKDPSQLLKVPEGISTEVTRDPSTDKETSPFQSSSSDALRASPAASHTSSTQPPNPVAPESGASLSARLPVTRVGEPPLIATSQADNRPVTAFVSPTSMLGIPTPLSHVPGESFATPAPRSQIQDSFQLSPPSDAPPNTIIPSPKSILQSALTVNSEITKLLESQRLHLEQLTKDNACDTCCRTNEVLFQTDLTPSQKVSILQTIFLLSKWNKSGVRHDCDTAR